MPGFGFPPGVAGGGGGGGGGTSNVTGGSGATYPTITAALLGETQTVVSDTTQAGTVAGSITGSAGLSATDNFYKDFWVVLTDTTPGNGLVCRYARVSAYVGATKVLTIDQPWNFGVGETYVIINPVRLWLNADIAEAAVTVNKSCEIDLQGHRIVGQVDVTAAPFCWIRGANGWITDGIQKSDIGMLRVDDCTVSRRGATIYALLMTNGSDLGRTVLYNCQFDGVVSGRRGFAGWEIANCRNAGVVDASGRVIPHRLVESVAGVAIVVTFLDLNIAGEFSGSIFYSENSITGPAANFIIEVNAYAAFENAVAGQGGFAVFHAIGGATLTMTTSATVSQCQIRWGMPATAGSSFDTIPLFAITRATSFTGTVNLSVGILSGLLISLFEALVPAMIMTDGAGDTSGSITVAGGFYSVMGEGRITRLHRVSLRSRLTGTILDSCSFSSSEMSVYVIYISAIQDSGAPSVTISGSTSVMSGHSFAFTCFFVNTGMTVSVGTWTVSGALTSSGAVNIPINIDAAVAGGTWLVSGAITLQANPATGPTTNIFLARHVGSGGTLTVSSATVVISGFTAGQMVLATSTTAGGIINVTAASVVIRGCRFGSASIFVNASTATSTATCTSAVKFEECQFDAALTVFNSTAAGGVAQAPASITFYDCVFESTFTDRTGGGTLTLAAASWIFYNSTFRGLVTLLGTPFTLLEFYETTFQGNSANNSITITGTRPTTYRFWKCTYVANIGLLLPEIIHEYEVRPAAAAIAAGNLLIIDATGAAAAQTAGGRNHGVALAATGGAAEAVVMVRRGVVFVDAEAATVAGSSCVVDAGGTPTRMIPGASVVGQTIGTALEADGTTRAGESYTVVDLC